MRYLICHNDDCGCPEPHRYATDAATSQEVSEYLWGRDVLQHIVYEGECPYRFHVSDIRLIDVLLQDFSVAIIRAYLPCIVWAGFGDLVHIGDGEHRTIINYFRWIDATGQLGKRRAFSSTASSASYLVAYHIFLLYSFFMFSIREPYRRCGMSNEGIFALMLLVSAILGAPALVCYIREGRRIRFERVRLYRRSLRAISGYQDTERAA